MKSTVGLAELADPVRRALYRAMARRALGWESGSAIVAWAGDALVAGWDSGPLAILAGLDTPPNEFEVDAYLERTLRALELPAPPRTELMRVLAVSVAGDLVAGTTPAHAGCRELAKLCVAAGYPEWMMAFHTADDALDLAEAGMHGTVAAAVERITDAARRLLEAAPP